MQSYSQKINGKARIWTLDREHDYEISAKDHSATPARLGLLQFFEIAQYYHFQLEFDNKNWFYFNSLTKIWTRDRPGKFLQSLDSIIELILRLKESSNISSIRHSDMQ